MAYFQSSTNNPYGHRPWQTRLYTSFANYSYLKQPQNTILRGDQTMRPEIYKPPELPAAGVGAFTIVTGSGRVIARARRRHQLLGAVPVYYGYPASQMIRVGPIFDGGFPQPGPMPVRFPPIPTGSPPVVPRPLPAPQPIAPIMLPPTIVPPVPTPVASAPDGTVWMLPGTPVTPGSPLMPAPPAELQAPGVAPGTTTTVATTPAPGSFMDWFTSQTLISGIPNGYLAAGTVFAIYFMGKRGRR